MKKTIITSFQLLLVLPLTGYNIELNQNPIEMQKKVLKTPQGTW